MRDVESRNADARRLQTALKTSLNANEFHLASAASVGI
jgi:hypothetical protein